MISLIYMNTTDTIYKELKARIRNEVLGEVYRKLNGKTVTQKSLADAFGVSQVMISKLSNRNPRH